MYVSKSLLFSSVTILVAALLLAGTTAGCSDDGSEKVDMVMEDMAGDEGDGTVDFDAAACPGELVSEGESCAGFPAGALCPGEIPCMCGGSMEVDCPCVDGSWACGSDCGEGPCEEMDMTDQIDIPVDLPDDIDASDTDAGDMETDVPESACSSDADCQVAGESCVGPGNPLCGVCNNAQSCQNSNQCGMGEVCDGDRVECLCVPSDTVCVPACASDMDCPDGETCQGDGTCSPTECQNQAGCPANFVCASNVCQRANCVEDSDCDDFCVNGSCYDQRGFCSPPAP